MGAASPPERRAQRIFDATQRFLSALRVARPIDDTK